MERHEIRGIYLNHARGWERKNFNFLAHLHDLQLLNLIDTPMDWTDRIDLPELANLRRSYLT